ncbi:MAG: serine--tRNA ligase [Spirochaetes bacterium]|nr:serine--tRNA ligase [Spirochaetota bacterium]
MLDPKYIRDNLDKVKENIQFRGVQADAEKVVDLYQQKSQLQVELDGLRSQRNENAGKMKGKLSPDERNVLIEEGKKLKGQIAALEENAKSIDNEFSIALSAIPNMTHPETPAGGEADSKEIRKVGEIKDFSFKPQDHVALGNALDIIDFDNGAKVSGQKFYFLKNEGALLELALIQYGMSKLVSKGFIPFLTPDMARTDIVDGIGFNPRGEETNIYNIESSSLSMIATAEITLGGLNQNKIFTLKELPFKMVGFSHCFRTEAGAAGQATRGLYRVHQFSKVEMFIICKPEDSADFHETLREIEEEIYQELKIPYRLLDIAAGDLGSQAYRKYDLEAWMPGRGEYGEITSTSNCTDFQSRRLNIRYKDENGKNQFVHMLNGTVIAVPRVIISILENNQNEDGTVDIPEVLIPFMGGVSKINKKGG